MTEILNYEAYFKEIELTLYDKCWWIDKIPDGINTVVDFGCSNGALCKIINAIKPDKFRYIGIDNNPKKIEYAKEFNKAYNSEFFNSLQNIPQDNVRVDNTILILNSVMHEVMYYLPGSELRETLREFNIHNFGFVAVRDMMWNDGKDLSLEEIRRIAEHPLFADYANKNAGYKECKYYAEFLLKYMHEVNWARECEEKYFGKWYRPLNYALSNYYETIFEPFSIPYLRNKWFQDFRITSNFKTHVKILYANAVYKNKYIATKTIL